MDNWGNYIYELEYFYTGRKLPENIDLNPYTHITNVAAFVKSHFHFIETYNGNPRFGAYIRRLYDLKEILEAE